MTGDLFNELALFDVKADAAEQHNVADQHPRVVARLKALADRYRGELHAK